MKKENPSVAPFAAGLELSSSSRLKFCRPSISVTDILGVTHRLMESKARWSRESWAELTACRPTVFPGPECGRAPLLGGWRPQVAGDHMAGGGFLQCVCARKCS